MSKKPIIDLLEIFNGAQIVATKYNVSIKHRRRLQLRLWLADRFLAAGFRLAGINYRTEEEE